MSPGQESPEPDISLWRSCVECLVRLLLFLVACTQGIGDRCQLDSDCDPGLVCVLPATWSCPDSIPKCPANLVGGSCQVAGPDLGEDLATSDQ